MLGAGDFSMIECCVLLALAGQPKSKCELIAQGVDVYRDHGGDHPTGSTAPPSCMAIPENQLSPEGKAEQRRIGKNGVLSRHGYGIGAEELLSALLPGMSKAAGSSLVRIVRRALPQSSGRRRFRGCGRDLEQGPRAGRCSARASPPPLVAASSIN